MDELEELKAGENTIQTRDRSLKRNLGRVAVDEERSDLTDVFVQTY